MNEKVPVLFLTGSLSPLTALKSCLATTSQNNYYLGGIYHASYVTK